MWRRQDNNALDTRGVQRVKGVRNIGNSACFEHLDTNGKALCRPFDLVELLGTGRWVPQHADPRERRNGLDEELQTFRTEIRKIQEHAGDVAARARKACDEADRHRIAFKIDGNDGRGRRGTACRLHRRRTGRDDDVDAIIHQFSRQGRQARQVSVGQTHDQLETRSLAVRPIQAFPNCGDACVHGSRLSRMQHADFPVFRNVLRVRCERPACHPAKRRAKKCDEFASPHEPPPH
jgi:hypothetical protein